MVEKGDLFVKTGVRGKPGRGFGGFTDQMPAGGVQHQKCVGLERGGSCAESLNRVTRSSAVHPLWHNRCTLSCRWAASIALAIVSAAEGGRTHGA